MLKKRSTIFFVIGILGVAILESPVLANINLGNDPFKDMEKSIKAGQNPLIESVTTIKTNAYFLGKVAWSPDSLYLAVIMTKRDGGDSFVIIINRKEKKIIKELPLSNVPSWGSVPIIFSPDGHYLAAAVTGQIRLWDARTWTKIRDIEGASEKDAYTPFSPISLVFSPDSKKIACLFESAFWWPPNQTKRSKVALEEQWDKIAKAKSNRTYVQELSAGNIGEYIGTVVEYNIFDKKIVFYFRAPKFENKTYFKFSGNLAYTPEGNYLINSVTKNRYDVSDDHATQYCYLQLRDSKIGKVVKELPIASPQNEIVIFEIIKGRLFTGTKHQDALSVKMPRIPTDSIREWNEDFSTPVKELKSHFKKIGGFSLSQNGKLLVVFSGQRAEIWDAEKIELLKEMAITTFKGGVGDCKISPDGKMIAITDMNNAVVQLITLK